MSWKPMKRTLPSISKVKLPGKLTLPEPADDMSPRSKNGASEELEQIGSYRDAPSLMSEFLSSLPVASHDVEKDYLNKFNPDTQEFNPTHNAARDIWFSDLAVSETSSWDSSCGSTMSWSDDVEVKATKQGKVFLDSIDALLYEDGPSSLKDEEIIDECLQLKRSMVFLRLCGTQLQNSSELPPDCLMMEEQEDEPEIIMSHGVIDDRRCLSPCIRDSDEFSESLDAHDHGDENLREKIKKAVLDQLSCYVMSEVMKDAQQVAGDMGGQSDTDSSSLSFDTLSVSTLADNLSGVLTVSRKSIHQSPRKSSSKITENFSQTRVVELPAQPKRFVSSSPPARKPNREPELSFTVLGVPKPLNCEPVNCNVRGFDSRGFHSAADRRKSGFWDRRFSCTDNAGVSKPSEERGGSAWGPSTRVVDTQCGFNAPRLQRHLALPPINNSQASTRVGKVLPCNSPESVAAHLNFKKKGLLSPLPKTCTVPEEGFSELQLAKKLMGKMPDRPSWGSGNRTNFMTSRDPNRWRRSKEILPPLTRAVKLPVIEEFPELERARELLARTPYKAPWKYTNKISNVKVASSSQEKLKEKKLVDVCKMFKYYVLPSL